ncbi:hypothetical protein [Pseudomonas akapageensis]|uniref:hypothetical protein n=1 Tax=Pseudomonas akapageensis TaxID=2609961 RepID=UPI00140DC375|nr:hypothetical protein [Pseudomonas akapageensis]
MRLVLVSVFTSLLLAGCMSTPNTPTLVLETKKAPEAYAQCVLPLLLKDAAGATMSETQGHYKIVVSSKVAADDVLEAYKAPAGGKVFLYERALLASSFGPSSLERAAHACI